MKPQGLSRLVIAISAPRSGLSVVGAEDSGALPTIQYVPRRHRHLVRSLWGRTSFMASLHGVGRVILLCAKRENQIRVSVRRPCHTLEPLLVLVL